MQVLESTDKITPKSVIRHRPIGNSKPPRKRSIITSASTPTRLSPVTPVARRASRVGHPGPLFSPMSGEPQKEKAVAGNSSFDDEYDEQESTDLTDESSFNATRVLPVTSVPSSQKSAVRRVQKTPLSASATPHATTSTTPRLKPLSRSKTVQPVRHAQQAHPLLYLGIGMLSMVVLWTVLSGVIHWAGVTLDDLRYGRPRTAQYDVVVGHNDSTANPSHFVVINLNRRIEVIELPGGDASHAHIYIGPQLFGAEDDLTPATLSFVDVNGDHKLDMIINVQGSHIVFINDQGAFRQPTATERHRVDLFLQHWQP